MYSYETILKALDLYKIYKSKRKVAKILNISRSTIIKWVNEYENNLIILTNVIKKKHKPF